MVKTEKVKIPEYKEYILANYEKMSLKAMARNLNISSCSGFKLLKELGLKSKPNRYFVTFNLNNTYFKEIDSIDKAYFLGLSFSDGNIYSTPDNRKRFQIALKEEDAYIIELFKNYLDYPGKLYKDKNCYKLIITSSEIFDDLEKLGCIERKSLKIRYPLSIPKNLQNHFIRGFFDGNGGISIDNTSKSLKGNISFSSTEEFLDVLRDIFQNLGIKCSKFYKRYKQNEISAGSMHIYFSKNKNNIFYTYLYENCENLYLKRKKEKFELILNQ